MGVLDFVKGVLSRMFPTEQISSTMEAAIARYYNITTGAPEWSDPTDDIETLNFAAYIDDVISGLITVDLGITMPDTPRGRWLQKHADYVLQTLKEKTALGLGNCGIMFKPNGRNVDYVEAGYFLPTDADSNGNIRGCVFPSWVIQGGYKYTKAEWHHFDGDIYRIDNACFKKRWFPGDRTTWKEWYVDMGARCSLTEVSEWSGISEAAAFEGIERPLFSYFKNPVPNRVDPSSPLGVPIWANAIKELKDLDIAWGRKAAEVEDSKHITFVDDTVIQGASKRHTRLARFVKGVDFGLNASEPIKEHVATLLTSQRIEDINSILAMISTKCGFSQGAFVLDEKTGIMTATQVEADDQETIRTIKNLRDVLKGCLDDLFYSLNVMADLYTDIPAETWDDLGQKITYRFADLTYNADEDRNRGYLLTTNGFYPKYYYLMKYEGYTEEEAKGLIEEAKADEDTESMFTEVAGKEITTYDDEVDKKDKEIEEGAEEEPEDIGA